MTYLFYLFSFTEEFIQLIVTRGNELASKIFFIGYSFFDVKIQFYLTFSHDVLRSSKISKE